jgi:hypothetical protein
MRLVHILFIGLMALTWKSGSGQQPLRRAIVLQAAELSISGTTNVNSFNCSLKKGNMCDTLTLTGNTLNEYTLFNGLEIGFDVADFDCDMTLMTNDFRHLLKYDKYPQIRIRIDQVQFNDKAGNESGGPVTAVITLLIGGEMGVEDIRDAAIHRIQKKVIFTGTHQVLMTRFNIKPPTKMFGTVRTKNALRIDFAIQIQ